MYCCWHKMAAVTSLMMSLLLLLLLLGPALGVASQNPECKDLQASGGVPLGDPLMESSVSLVLPLEKIEKNRTRFELGNRADGGTFTVTHLLVVRKIMQNRKPQINMKLTTKEGDEVLAQERLSSRWFEGVEARLVLSRSGLIFSKTNGDEILKFEWSTSRLRDVDEVEVKDIDKVSRVQLCSPLPETTTEIPTRTPSASTTTPTTTTTPSPTTIPTTTTPTTTTTTPSTTTASPTTITTLVDQTTNREDVIDPDSEVLSPDTTLRPCEVVKSVGVAEGSIDAQDCQAVPWWTWVCTGLLGAFVIITLMLVGYTVVLYRRNFRMEEMLSRQGHYLRGRISSPGGYGEAAKDVHYLPVNNQSLGVGNTMPRLACKSSPLPSANPTPSPLPPFDTAPPITVQFGPTTPNLKLSTSSIPFVEPPSPLPPPPVSCTAPRNSSYRRSFSHQPELEFPPPPESPPPMTFLTLPASSGQRGYTRESLPGLHEETAPLKNKPRSHCSEDAMADDENSDVSLDREFGIIS